MPRDGDFKRLVRRRMRKTGEAYTTARSRLTGRPHGRGGGAAPEPFDRFSPRARQALVAAHEEACGSEGEIGAEQLLAGVLRVEDGMAVKVLDQLGVDRRALRRGPKVEGSSSAARLTDEVRRAIELAVREAAGLGHGYVGTEHLLLGILAEGGSAGRLLAGAGATLERVRERARREPAAESTPAPAGAWEPLAASDVASLLERARAERLTGALRLRRRGAGPAVLYFLFGHLFHAVHRGEAGDEAVLAVLSWPAHEFSADLDAGSRLPADGTVRASIAQLIERAGNIPER